MWYSTVWFTGALLKPTSRCIILYPFTSGEGILCHCTETLVELVLWAVMFGDRVGSVEKRKLLITTIMSSWS